MSVTQPKLMNSKNITQKQHRKLTKRMLEDYCSLFSSLPNMISNMDDFPQGGAVNETKLKYENRHEN